MYCYWCTDSGHTMMDCPDWQTKMWSTHYLRWRGLRTTRILFRRYSVKRWW